MPTRYSGKGGRLYGSDTGTGTAVPVASLSRWSLDMSQPDIDTTCFEDGGETGVKGFPAVRGQFAGFLDVAEDWVYTAAESADGTKLYLYPNRSIATKYWYGPAWVDYQVDVAVNNAMPVTGTFKGNGAWSRNWA